MNCKSANNLGAQIETARKQAKLTRLALATKIGVDPQTIYAWERDGQRPTDANLAAIAKACGCTFAPPQLILSSPAAGSRDGNSATE